MVVTLVSLTLALPTLFVWGRVYDQGRAIELGGGAMTVGWANGSGSGTRGCEWGVFPSTWEWVPIYDTSDPRFRVIVIPLWTPLLLGLALATPAALHMRRMRFDHLCPACGYDRTGLAAEAVCPECGKDRMSRAPLLWGRPGMVLFTLAWILYFALWYLSAGSAEVGVTALVWGVFALPIVLLLRKRSFPLGRFGPGRCHRCGYELRDLPQDAPCPECGHEP